MTTLATLAAADTAVGPDWLRAARQAAWQRWAALEWPDSRRDEFWRSTPFDRIPIDLPLVSGVGGQSVELARDGLTAGTDHAALLRIWDGGVVDVAVGPTAAAAGVVVADLAAAAETHRELVAEHLGTLTAGEDRTVAANDAAWTAGALVWVPPEVRLDGPIGIRVHVSTPGAHLPRVLVVLGAHARAVVYLEHTSAEVGPTVVDEVCEFIVGDGARLDVVTLQEWEGELHHLSLQKAAVHRDAHYRHLNLTIGGRTVRLRPDVDLVGQGSMCEPLGIYFADEGQHFDLQPLLRHLAPHTTSRVLYRGALQGRSRAVFRGDVYIAREAAGADTYEENKALLLSDGARADSTPFLEIECADVRAGHGSATGQVAEDQLFYLQARGLRRADALRLVVLGFFTEVLDRIDLPGVRERALAHLEREISITDLSRVGVVRMPGREVA